MNMTMTSSLESAASGLAGSIDDILSSTLLPLQLKCPERRFIFRIADGKSRVRMPREEIERVIDEIVMNTRLFPRKSPLFVQGSCNEKNYLLAFISTDSGLNTEQAEALKTYRNTIVKKTCEQQMALCRARLLVELCGGQFQLRSEVDQRLSVTISLPRE